MPGCKVGVTSYNELMKNYLIDFDKTRDFTIYYSIIAEIYGKALWRIIRKSNNRIVTKYSEEKKVSQFENFPEGKNIKKFNSI